MTSLTYNVIRRSQYCHVRTTAGPRRSLPLSVAQAVRPIRLALWGLLGLVTLLWVAADPGALWTAAFFRLRDAMIQWTGLLAMACMSVAMILALRPRWPERWCGGLDKMYRLHKWLGIGALSVSIIHWLWSQGPKWAVGFGWLARPPRGPQPVIDNAVEAFLRSQRGTAEGLGEWAFYAAVALIVLALIPRFPYRWFFKTHRILAISYLVLVFHAVVLTQFAYWFTPLGVVLAVLLAYGTYAAIIVLLRRVGAARQVEGRIVALTQYPELRVLETEIAIPEGWPGHRAGQFAFAMSDAAEGAHPYTIASAWHDADRRITFVTKALGDHTSRLPDRLRVGQAVRVEGPYGCFTFECDRPRQIWIGAGIGITPFIARLKQIAHERGTGWQGPSIDLFHPTADFSAAAIAKLTADAQQAGVRLHVLHDARHGRLNGERIRAEVPDWREASIWFCGPARFGESLRHDFAAQGFPVKEHFHQELFAMR